jgi:hypothetical protein
MQTSDFVAGLREAQLSDSYLAICAGSSIPPDTVRSLHERVHGVLSKLAEFDRLKRELQDIPESDPSDEIAALERRIAEMQREVAAVKLRADRPRQIRRQLQVTKEVIFTYANDQFVSAATRDERASAGLLTSGEPPPVAPAAVQEEVSS